MYQNENWETVKKRYEAWWEGEIIDRAVIKVSSPRDGAREEDLFSKSSAKEKWWDPEYMVEAQKAALRNTYFGGDAFAWFFPNLGTDLFSSYLGAELTYTEYTPGKPPFEYTSWAKHFVERWEDHVFRFDPENAMWKRTVALVDHALSESNGEYMVGFPDIIGSIDCLAAIRGTENLCMDLLDEPEIIKQKLDEASTVFKQVYDRLHEILYRCQFCAPATLPVWHPGRYFVHINDFTCMISPEMYEKIILPDLQDELDFLDASIYHLDGTGALKHLDFLLENPKLKAIQWVPGEGREGAERWIPLYKRIQNAGKNIYLYCKPGEVETILNELSPGGLLLETRCDSEAEAKDLVRLVEKLSCK